jgi:hypothetical protein
MSLCRQVGSRSLLPQYCSFTYPDRLSKSGPFSLPRKSRFRIPDVHHPRSVHFNASGWRPVEPFICSDGDPAGTRSPVTSVEIVPIGRFVAADAPAYAPAMAPTKGLWIPCSRCYNAMNSMINSGQAGLKSGSRGL